MPGPVPGACRPDLRPGLLPPTSSAAPSATQPHAIPRPPSLTDANEVQRPQLRQRLQLHTRMGRAAPGRAGRLVSHRQLGAGTAQMRQLHQAP